MFHLASVDVNAKTSKKPAVVPPIGSVGSVPAASSGGRRRRRKRVVAACPRVVLSNNPGGAETKEPFTLSGDSQVTSVSDLKSVRTQVFAVKDKEVESLLTVEEIRAYCSRLFEIQVEHVTNKRCHKQDGRVPAVAEAKPPQNRVLMMPEEAKVIRYQLPSTDGDPLRRPSKEGLINLTGKSFVCILHEYCQNVIRRPPTYQTVVQENDRNPYQLTVVIDGKPCATGSGQSKKQARLDAARNALARLIPDFEKIVGSDSQSNGPSPASERDLQLFDSISVTDPRLYELSVRMALPTPYNLLLECLNRSCVPESDLKSSMVSQGRSKHFFTLQLNERSVKVPCKNKREGRHLAAQHLLARLHPEVQMWSDLLRMYGPGSKPDKKTELETIQGAQAQEKSTVKTSLIRLLKAKMRELATQWEENGGSVHPKGKFFVSPDSLPVVTFHPDSKTDLYNSVPETSGSHTMPSSPNATSD
ncbi:Microprocessor complex subunit DGCR8 [Fasciolopsis buskii]|uniref:Microprocessor complex subunit DGCR8 n=1 Tax=Fasciolopsis buskii TaxID=27845 RepID=A0A8E0RNB2_9TREM|nr:Microprocessor complex subunit DGCR8 [Fasciolopsis buski]